APSKPPTTQGPQRRPTCPPPDPINVFCSHDRSMANALDPLDVAARLDELKELSDGWLDGKGRALSRAGLDWLTEWYGRERHSELHLTYLYTTPDGGVQAQWTRGAHDSTLVIALERHRAAWHGLHRNTGNEVEPELDTNDAEAGVWIAHSH